MRGALCIVAAMLGPFVLGVGAQTDSRPMQPAAAVPASAESSPPSNDQRTPGNDTDHHNWHLRLGAISASYFQGPAFYPYAPYGYYPFYSMAPWDPFWGPYYSGYTPNLAYSYGKGEVKLAGTPKDAKVYVDGAFAGTADGLKHIWLDPGAYDLAVAIPGRKTFQQRIYMLSGKTLKITANQAPNTPEKEEP